MFCDYYVEYYGCILIVIQNVVLRVQLRVVDKFFDFGFELGKFIFFVGCILFEKQVDCLIEVVKLFLGEVKFVIVGGSSYFDDYVVKVCEFVDENVVFLGQVDYEMVYEFYSNCFIFVLFFVMEGFFIVLFEVVSFGICIVVIDIFENWEVVGDVGFYFDVDSIEELCDCLVQLIERFDLVDSFWVVVCEQVDC